MRRLIVLFAIAGCSGGASVRTVDDFLPPDGSAALAWGTGASDMWIQTGPSLAHYDGSGWTKVMPPFAPQSACAGGRGLLWIAGADRGPAQIDAKGAIVLDRGSDAPGGVRFACSDGNVTASLPKTATAAARAWVFDGARFNEISSPPAPIVWPRGPADLWAQEGGGKQDPTSLPSDGIVNPLVQNQSGLWHFDGGRWNNIPIDQLPPVFGDGDPRHRVSPLPPQAHFPADDVWLECGQPVPVQFDGVRFNRLGVPMPKDALAAPMGVDATGSALASSVSCVFIYSPRSKRHGMLMRTSLGEFDDYTVIWKLTEWDGSRWTPTQELFRLTFCDFNTCHGGGEDALRGQLDDGTIVISGFQGKSAHTFLITP